MTKIVWHENFFLTTLGGLASGYATYYLIRDSFKVLLCLPTMSLQLLNVSL